MSPEEREAVAEMRAATRDEIQAYLESRGFAVYDDESTETLREAAILDAIMVEGRSAC